MIRVAGYCRVSTGKEDQHNSFESQQRFFREYIQRNPEWVFFEIYADEGITGTSTHKRQHFNRMIGDAYNNKFDLILTKEVSRFSRNILDTILYTRELKALGIGVVFMSDGFCSLDPDAELRLSIMGSIAQEESRKTSTRVKWGQTRQMERGVVFGRSLLGYDVKNGILAVEPKGAQIVKLIFYKYGIEKKGTSTIARELKDGRYSTFYNRSEWSAATIMKILKNEKYVGDLLQKKSFTPDYLTHKKKYNHGEEKYIYLQNHHEAIIDRALWNTVQEEIINRNRKTNASGSATRYLFSGKIRCAECGAAFVSRMKAKSDGTFYRRWACYNAVKYGSAACNIGKHLRDDLLRDIMLYIISNLKINAEAIGNDVVLLIKNLFSHSKTDGGKCTVQQLGLISAKKTKAIDAYLSGVLSKDAYQQIIQEYENTEDKLREKLEKEQKLSQYSYSELYEKVMTILCVKSFSDAFIKELLDHITVAKDGCVTVQLNGLDTKWVFMLER